MKKLGLVTALLAIISLSVSGCAPAATGTDTGAGSNLYLIGLIVLIFVLFYFTMIRPQRKQQKEHQKMMQGLQKGDQVITAGGIFGTIDSIDEGSILIKVESGAILRVAKGSVVVRQTK